MQTILPICRRWPPLQQKNPKTIKVQDTQIQIVVCPTSKEICKQRISNPSLRRSHRSEYFTQNTCCDSSKEKNMRDYEPNYGRASPTTVQYRKFLQLLGRDPTVLLEVKVLPKQEATVTVPHAYRLRNTDPQINKR